MTAIINALTSLNQSLEKLENVAIEQEQKTLKMKQQDLFVENQITIDPALLARKLDTTIERIELLLREG